MSEQDESRPGVQGAPDSPDVRADRAGSVDGSRLLARLRKLSETREALADESDSIGGYRVEEEVGRGGMGVVHRVVDEELRRSLAMKLSSETLEADDPTAFDSQRAARFLEEAQVTGQLDHPGIVPVHELGVDRDGRLYFTMRLVQGRTLDEIFQRVHGDDPDWTRTRSLGVLLKVCEAMAFAHERRVIHRDLKPANVMVGRFGVTYVMDWGLAKILTSDGRAVERETERDSGQARPLTIVSSARREGSSHGSGSLETLEGDVVGTPAYMSPEQAVGNLDELGPATDIYAAGALLYHLLAGHAPFHADGASPAPHLVLRWLMEGAPRPLAEVAPEAPDELVAICEKAMARKPADRYATMLAMAEDLRAFLEDRVVKAHEVGAVAEFRKWVRRNRGLAASLAAAVLVALIGTAAVAWVQHNARITLESTNSELAQANEDLGIAKSAAEEARGRALANAEEARWQSYVANLGAAAASLDLSAPSEARARLAQCDPEHRGWEWDYLQQRCDASLLVFPASEAFVTAVAYSPDFSLVASGDGGEANMGSATPTVGLWDAETGALQRRLEGPTARISTVAFSPAGTEVAAGCGDGVFRMWDVESGELAIERPGSGERFVFHPDGIACVFASAKSRTMTLWDLFEDEERTRFAASANVRSLALNADASRLVAGLVDGRIQVFDAASGERTHTLDTGALDRTAESNSIFRGILGVSFDANGAVLYASSDGDAGRWTLGDDRPELLRGHERAVTSILPHPNGSFIATASLDGTVRFWDAGDLLPLEVLPGHDAFVTGLAFSPNGHRMVSGSYDKTLRFWDGQPGATTTTLRGEGGEDPRAYDLGFDPKGDRLAWRSRREIIRVTDARTGEDLFALPGFIDFGPRMILRQAYTPDGERLIIVNSGDRTRTWTAETGDIVQVTPENLPDVRHIGFAPDRSRFAAWFAREGGWSVGVWSVESGELLTVLEPPKGEVDGWHVALAEDGRIAAGMASGLVVVWDESGAELARYEAGGVLAELRFTPNGSELVHLLYDAWDSSIYVHDAKSGARKRVLRGHAQPACIDISADGSRYVTGNWDSTISLWHPERGEIVGLRGHHNAVFDVAFAPTGQRLASVEAGGIHRIWETVPIREREAHRIGAARRRFLSPRSRALVEPLMEELVFVGDVVDRLNVMLADDDTLRDAALRMARSRDIDTVAVALGAWEIVLNADRPREDYERALRMGQAMRMMAPFDDELPFSLMWNFEGGAHYRLGEFDEALRKLRRHEELNAGKRFEELPVDLLFLAATLLERGERAEAQRLVDADRGWIGSLRPEESREARGVLEGLQSMLAEMDRRLAE